MLSSSLQFIQSVIPWFRQPDGADRRCACPAAEKGSVKAAANQKGNNRQSFPEITSARVYTLICEERIQKIRPGITIGGFGGM